MGFDMKSCLLLLLLFSDTPSIENPWFIPNSRAAAAAAAAGGCGAAAPYVEHQKAMTIRNDVNLKKESFRVEADVDNPGKALVCFTFDATVDGRLVN